MGRGQKQRKVKYHKLYDEIVAAGTDRQTACGQIYSRLPKRRRPRDTNVEFEMALCGLIERLRSKEIA